MNGKPPIHHKIAYTIAFFKGLYWLISTPIKWIYKKLFQ